MPDMVSLDAVAVSKDAAGLQPIAEASVEDPAAAANPDRVI